MNYRYATHEDAALLATLNQKLIRDEGHRNAMSLAQLTARMDAWTRGEYQAVVFEESSAAVGYALFRREPDYIYLRQLFVLRARRRQGIGRHAITWLWRNAWLGAPKLRIEVLLANTAGREFWRSVGLRDYSVTMEADAPNDG